jgi:hypothetical protein
MVRTFAIGAMLIMTPSAANSDDQKGPTAEEVKAAQDRLMDFLKGLKGAETARVTALAADGVPATFPDHILFSVLFPQYPVARIAPEPLKSSNVVAVPKAKDGKPAAITDLKELEMFFKSHARAVKSETETYGAVEAWLRGAAELNQDGFYKFTVKAESFAAADTAVQADGRAKVEPTGGNKGEITAKLSFKDGKLTAVDTKVALSPGPRPICQSTKLLDPDPIVRRMAEDAIRVMGSAAKPYLDEQRAKASPELRDAIDRIWERIRKEGR